MNLFKKIFILSVLFICVVQNYAYAAVQKRAELVVDVQTGKILHSYASEARRYPASVTKMMTLYLVFEALEQGTITPDTKMLMTREIRTLGSRNGGVIFPALRVGQTITVKEAVYTLITKSANDIAILFSRTLAGSERQFANRMTQKATQLGMYSSHFTNPSGLPDVKQYTTARDMALLGIRLMQKFPQYYKYFGTKSIIIKGQNLHNHNTMLGQYAGMDGFKTGFINMSGFNLVASAQRGDKRLIAVVFGGNTASQRNYRMKQILDYGWKQVKNPSKNSGFLGAKFTDIALLKTSYNPLNGMKNNVRMFANNTAQDNRFSGQNSAVIPLSQKNSNSVFNQNNNINPKLQPVKMQPVGDIKTVNLNPNPVSVNKTVTLPISGAAQNTNSNTQQQGWNVISFHDSSQDKNILTLQHQNDPSQTMVVGKDAKNNFQKDFIADIISEYDKTGSSQIQKKNDITNSIQVANATINPTEQGGDWSLQVGAFAHKKTANHYMSNLQNNIHDLSGAKTIFIPVKKGTGTIYRALFSGLHPAAAKSACKTIKQQGKQCILMSVAS